MSVKAQTLLAIIFDWGRHHLEMSINITINYDIETNIDFTMSITIDMSTRIRMSKVLILILVSV